MRGVFLDLETVDRGDLELALLEATPVDWTFHGNTAPDEIHHRIREAEIVISNKVGLDRAAIQSANRLRLVCVAATGTDKIDLDTAGKQNISVCNVTGYATPSVVEHVFSQILMLNRRLLEYRRALEQGHWQTADHFSLLAFPVRELAGLTLGIIGYGELGRAVAVMGKAFGMEIRVAERRGSATRPGRTPLETLLANADIVSLHCPFTSETRNLIDAGELDLMRDDAILINTARGGIVNEGALLSALQSGRIAGAAIDVLQEEPPRNGSPLLEVSLPNLLVTPHIAWASTRARQRLIDGVAANIRAWLDGTPRNIVRA
jgi:glycerate dehydrogenase